MMQDKNTATLHQAIDRLPEYDPPPAIWANVAEQLPVAHAWDAVIRQLPNYTPPTTIWEALEGQLPAPPPRFNWSIVIYGVATVAAVLLLAAIWYPKPQPPAPPKPAPPVDVPSPTVPIAAVKTRPKTARSASGPTVFERREEKTDPLLTELARQADDPGFALLESFCQTALPACENTEFKQLKSELDELTGARTQLKNALGDYAQDSELVAQLVQVEQARNRLLQQLIAFM